MKLRTKSVGIALTVVLATALLGSAGAQDASSSASLLAQRGEIAESILAAKERAMGEAFDASIRAYLKSRMEALSVEQLAGLSQQGADADLPLVLGSVTSDLVYTPVTPCRVFDSRTAAGGPGPIPANGQWNVYVVGSAAPFAAQGGSAMGCGVPVGSTSAIINFVTVSPAGPGDIRAWAVANPQPLPPLAAIINYGSVVGLPAIANGVAVPLCNPAATSCTAGDLRLQADTSGTNILGDVVGYFGAVTGVVTAVNSIAGPVTIAAGANIAVTSSGSTLTIANTAPVNAGTVTSVGSGSGLTGGPITDTGSLSIAAGGVATSMIANGAVGAAQITTGAVGLTQIDTAQVQARVGSACVAGSSIRVVNADGTVTCQADSNSGGTVTSVATGGGLTGGPISTSGTVAVATGGITSAMISNGAVGAAQINTAQVQTRVATICPVGEFLRGINADGSVVCGTLFLPTVITTVDDPPVNGVGEYTSLAIGADGLPVISYRDQTAGALKVAKCVNAACTGASIITTVDDPVNQVGINTSIAIGADGLPVISYQDLTARTLKVAKCVNAACTGTSTITTVDDPPVNDVGYGTSIAIGNDGFPVISYGDGLAGALKVAKCVNAACTGASTITTVDDPPVNSVGVGSNSVAIGADGFPVISYSDFTAGTLKVAKCVNAACTGVSTITTVDDPANSVGEFNSIAMGGDGFPVISYLDRTANSLKVAKCLNAACTFSIITTADPGGSASTPGTSIAIGNDGFPIISYFHESALSLKVAKCVSATCQGTSIITTLDDQASLVGQDSSIAIGSDGFPVISYSAAGILKVAKCVNVSCVP